MTRIAVVLVAAGMGERLGAGIPKALVKVAGRTLLEHSLANVAKVKGLNHTVIAAPAKEIAQFQEFAAAALPAGSFTVVAGGSTRQESIAAALSQVMPEQTEVVLVHDVARCFASATLFDRVALAVSESGSGALPVLPVVDTIKRADGTDILETIDRSHLRIAQTPQGFPTGALLAAYAETKADYTDDAALFQAAGGKVIAVLGEAAAFKVTTPEDLDRAERHLAEGELRTGIGTDVHRFGTEGTLRLAGIDWPGERALEGHSDGDAVAHAIVDSLLAAAGLGDIGGVFGVDRPEFKAAAGELFIRHTLGLLAEQGWRVVNVSVQIVGNRPKLAPRREAAEAAMTQLVGAPVSVGATTTDGLGFLGNSEGVAAVATALIRRTAKVG